MFKNFGTVGALVAGLTLAACSGGPEGANSPTTGSVNFDLTLPDEQTVDTINLQISCPASNVTQSHVLNVVKGSVTASFGGLTPGDCTVSLATQASDGTDCTGSKAFTVVAGQTVEVEVTLLCQAVNMSDDGAAVVIPTFDKRACSADRIKKVYAIPANVLTGESTTVEAEVHAGAVVGTPAFSWSVRNDATNTGVGTLATATCAAGSSACQAFTCTGLGASPVVDTRTGLPSAGVFVSLKFEDDDCFDTEEVWVQCVQASQCGDGAKEGAEACDDGNLTSEDGCSASCVVESCGDGIIQAGLQEVCDGTVGVGANQACASDCKSLINNPVCGDGAKNQPSEECDGTDGIVPGQTCGADCKIVVACGNGVVEAGEECDETSATCVACKRVAEDLCTPCLSTLPEIGEFLAGVCTPDQACADVLSCLKANPTCWTEIAPAACYCGNSQADIDACENPSFVPQGDCAAIMKAGAGENPANADVLARYFDFNYSMGNATVIWDSAFISCNAQCF